MARMPGPVPFLIFPFETAWIHARAGKLLFAAITRAPGRRNYSLSTYSADLSGEILAGIAVVTSDSIYFREADLWGVRGSHRNKGVSQAGFTYRPSPSTTTGMGRASVGMFRFPQSVNCSVRRLFSI
jgi:hypothetical protein